MLRKSRWPVVQWQDTGLWSLEWRFESSPASQNVFPRPSLASLAGFDSISQSAHNVNVGKVEQTSGPHY